MIKPTTHEIGRLRTRINALEKQCEHDAWVKAQQADRIAFLGREVETTRTELDDAVRLGTGYATLGRALTRADSYVGLSE